MSCSPPRQHWPSPKARRYSDELRAKADFEALVDTSPVGVLVFDAKTRRLLSRNRETIRIVRGLHAPGRSLPELLSVMTFKRPDGREIPLQELPTERALRSGETVLRLLLDEVTIDGENNVNLTLAIPTEELVSIESPVSGFRKYSWLLTRACFGADTLFVRC